jgi:hypothetical protein
MVHLRRHVPRVGRIVIARRRDAAEVAISTHGNAALVRLKILTEEVAPQEYNAAA